MTKPMTTETTDLDRAAAAYLKLPYSRLVIPEDDGTFRAEVLEFSGCLATGDTAVEALSAIEEAALEWLVAAMSQGQKIPEPAENAEFSGKLVLRLPRSLHKKATRFADHDGVSLNQLIVASLANYVGQFESTRNQPAKIDTVNVVAINQQYTTNLVSVQKGNIPQQSLLMNWRELVFEPTLAVAGVR
jgi:predicted RNase H-like HicB family nuclease